MRRPSCAACRWRPARGWTEEPVPRYRLTLEYDGGPYKGFQLQDGVPTVQASLERAIAGFARADARVHVAGRTDTGVHALGQVIHFDLERDWRREVVRSARGRRYLNRVIHSTPPGALERARAWWVKTPLDLDAMAEAAALLLGTHDFTTFRDAHCQSRSPVKTLDAVQLERVEGEVRLRYAARSFLHRQVRSMTGSLVEVGAGRWSKADFASALAACERSACGQVAPPHGLYLTGVDYGPSPEVIHATD